MAYTETEADFRQLAPMHLANAYKLLERPASSLCDCARCEEHVRGAMYLAGYAIELILKAYLIRSLRKADWREAVRALKRRGINVTGPRGHSLPTLLRASGLDTRLPAGVSADYGTCSTWSSEWRYASVPRAHLVGTQFVQAAEGVHAWVAAQP